MPKQGRRGRPSGVRLRNIDICSRVIDEMRKRHGTIGVTDVCHLCRSSQRNNNHQVCGFVAPTEWLTEDALSLDSIEDNSCHVIFDKATLDALLSHGGDEQGETSHVQRLFTCVLRKLIVGGRFLLISGNDPSIIFPYVYETQPVGQIDDCDGDQDQLPWSIREIVKLPRVSSPRQEEDGSFEKAVAVQPAFNELQMSLYVLERLF